MTSEEALLQHIYARSANLHGREDIVVGPGDDCAVLRSAGGLLLLSVDQVVEGRHYEPKSTPVDLIARKAVARSVSDIAAMGGFPVAALATGALRDDFNDDNELFDAMARWAKHWRCPLVGGDIARVAGPTVLTVTVMGRTARDARPILRSGAQAGDGVYVTGALGGSLASGRHLSFEPRVHEGEWLLGALGARLHAMIDISDGLGRDAARVADASGVRIEIEGGSIPLHEGVTSWREGVSDGEDYELFFAAAGDVPSTCPITNTPITRIGTVSKGSGCIVRMDGGATDVSSMGWDHGGER